MLLQAIDKLEQAIDRLRQQIADMSKQSDEQVSSIAKMPMPMIHYEPLQSGEIQELRKMMSAHVKDVTALQKKISTLVCYLSLCV